MEALLSLWPDQRLEKYEILPYIVVTPEFGLMYNGYHYNTLVAEDSTMVIFNQEVEKDDTDDGESDEKLMTEEDEKY